MKHAGAKSLLATLAIVAFAGALWTALPNQESESDQKAAATTTPSAPAREAGATRTTTPAAGDAKRRAEHTGYEPQAADFSEGEVVLEWGDFVAMRIVNENCRDVLVPVLRQGGIEYEPSVECDRNLYIDHAYADLPTDALRKLAEQDGAAALILADRLSEHLVGRHEPIQRLYVHAFILSAEQQAFDALYDYQNGGLVRTNDELDIDRAINGWIWSRVGEELGYRGAEEVRAFEMALSAENIDLAQAQEEVHKWIDELNARRMSAVGQKFR